MTAICGGGTSGPKPGVNASVVVDRNYVQSLLPPALQFLYPYLPWMSSLEIGDVSTFCANDPPLHGSLPSAADFYSFITGGPVSQALAVNSFLQALAKEYLWRSLCQCTTGSPTAVSPPSDPGNLPGVNPSGSVTPNLPLACYDFTSSLATYTGGNGLTRALITSDGTNPAAGPSTRAWWVQWDTTTHVVTAPAPPLTLTYLIQDTRPSSPISFSNPAYTRNAGGTVSLLLPIPAQANSVFYTVNAGTGAGTTSESTHVRLWCTTGAPSAADCCPGGNSNQQNLLNQILELVTLVQRQQVPFGYVLGAAHTGLTGSGTVSVQGLLGAKIEPTVLPPWTGVAVGDPDTLWLESWVNWGNADGWTPREFLRSSPHLSMPPLAGQFTELGYSLAPGVTVTITELVREAS